MKRYRSYKDSAIEWIVEIPEHWKIVKLKRATQFLYGVSLSNENRLDGKVPVYGSNGVTGYHNEAITESPCIVIGRKGSFGKVNYSDKECFPIDTTFYIDTTATHNDLRWLYYLLLTVRLDSFSKDSAVPGLNREEAYERIIPLPPFSEQQSIATYLDRKTHQIDTLIEKKQKLIDILKEQRTAIINQAVTKGLNPDVKLKDSGIEWLGEIPEHWDVKKLKYLAVNERYSFVDGPFGSDLKNEEYTDTGVPLIQLNNIGIGEHIIRNLKFISKEKAEQLYKHKVLPNDIIIAKMAEPVARSAKVKPDFKEYVVVADCMKFRPALDTINVDFLVYTLNRGYVTAQAEVQSTGTTRIRIGLTDAKKLKVVVPPIEEQNYIVDNLDENIKKIDKTVKKRGRQIDLLKEYRTALISEVVTGKIDVRDSGIQAVIHS